MPAQPTLINLPPPPADPATPSETPGTPTSTTTSMSELSTVAIKDGHRGHLPHTHANAPADAERADRISRLAGLERLVGPSARYPLGVPPGPSSNLTPGAAAPPQSVMTGYFDSHGNPIASRELSTVGSASATASVGGRTTWASGSLNGDKDQMSEDAEADVDMELDEGEPDRSSVGGMTDEGTESLVAFGEGARTPARQSYGSPALGTLAAGKQAPPALGPLSGPSAAHPYAQTHAARAESLTPTSAANVALETSKRARNIDGMERNSSVAAVDSSPARRA